MPQWHCSPSFGHTLPVPTHTFATFASRGEQKSLRQVTIISKRPPEEEREGRKETRSARPPCVRSYTRLSLALHFIARSQPGAVSPELRPRPTPSERGVTSSLGSCPGLSVFQIIIMHGCASLTCACSLGTRLMEGVGKCTRMSTPLRFKEKRRRRVAAVTAAGYRTLCATGYLDKLVVCSFVIG